MRVWILVVIAQEIKKKSLGTILKKIAIDGNRLRNEESSVQWEHMANDNTTKRKIDMEYIVYLH